MRVGLPWCYSFLGAQFEVAVFSRGRVHTSVCICPYYWSYNIIPTDYSSVQINFHADIEHILLQILRWSYSVFSPRGRKVSDNSKIRRETSQRAGEGFPGGCLCVRAITENICERRRCRDCTITTSNRFTFNTASDFPYWCCANGNFLFSFVCSFSANLQLL